MFPNMGNKNSKLQLFKIYGRNLVIVQHSASICDPGPQSQLKS